MPQPRKPRKTDDPELIAHVEKLRRAGLPVNREAAAAEFGVSTGVVQSVRTMVDAKLARENGKSPDEFTGVRLVRDFNGRKLYYIRRYRRFLEQEKLGRLAGKSRGEVGHLERLLRRPTLTTLNRLTAALGLYKTRRGKVVRDEDGQPVLDPSQLCGKFAVQPAELIAEGETKIYDPLHPVPLHELREEDHERRQTA